ncbi:MFS transporter [Phenylobacterium sp.]|jgi:EmrB/QacA subfamily drug resistance transporter|uniref:MFS transporter n=1 Tax=Phenylobacterium sp. TaxID=1871053 RepID=UPI002F42C697
MSRLANSGIVALERAESDRAVRGWLVPAIIGSALLMQSLSATVLFNALPVIAHALHEDPLRLNLAVTLYLLSSAVFLPVSGWAADKFGARRILVLAMVLYALSSAMCGFATSLWALLSARILQGVASAMMVPVGRLVLLRTTPKDELVGAMSVLTMPALLGPVLGPVVGGAIVTFWDWRWIFFMNLPIAVIGVVLVLRHVPNVEEQGVPPLDWRGVILTGVGLAGLIFGFENLGRDALPPAAVAALFIVGAVSLWLYGRHARRTPNAVVDLSLFRLPTFNAAVMGGGFMRIALGASPFLLAMLFQIGFGLSPFRAGLLTFISAAGGLVMKTVAPPILRRFGFRRVLIVNGFITSSLFVAYALFQPSMPQWTIMLVLLAGGFFRSLQFTSLNGLSYADIDQPRMSRASTMASMSQQVVQSVGVGLAALLLHATMQLRGETRITVDAIAPAFVIIGLITFVSLAYYIRLPANAGDEMNGRLLVTEADS